MMYKKEYRVFVEKIKAIMEKYGKVTTHTSPWGSTMYYLDNTPYGKFNVYINEFQIKQKSQYMCLKLSEPTKIPDSLIKNDRLDDGFNGYNGKYMKWCSTFEYMEFWFRELLECIFETEE